MPESALDCTTHHSEPTWAKVDYEPVDFQAMSYYAAPKSKDDAPKSLDEVDPELLATYEKLGIPLKEQEVLAGVAVDAVFDSVSVATTFKKELAEKGIIFCSFSEAVQEHPELVKKYLGSVVPQRDNFFGWSPTSSSLSSMSSSSWSSSPCSSFRGSRGASSGRSGPCTSRRSLRRCWWP